MTNNVVWTSTHIFYLNTFLLSFCMKMELVLTGYYKTCLSSFVWKLILIKYVKNYRQYITVYIILLLSNFYFTVFFYIIISFNFLFVIFMYKLEQYVHGSISVVITSFLYIIFIKIVITICIVGVGLQKWASRTKILLLYL